MRGLPHARALSKSAFIVPTSIVGSDLRDEKRAPCPVKRSCYFPYYFYPAPVYAIYTGRPAKIYSSLYIPR